MHSWRILHERNTESQREKWPQSTFANLVGITHWHMNDSQSFEVNFRSKYASPMKSSIVRLKKHHLFRSSIFSTWVIEEFMKKVTEALSIREVWLFRFQLIAASFNSNQICDCIESINFMQSDLLFWNNIRFCVSFALRIITCCYIWSELNHQN